MPLDAPAPSTIRHRRDHIRDLQTLIRFIKGINLRDGTNQEWPWYAIYDEVLRYLCLSLPRIRGNQKRSLYLFPQGRFKRKFYEEARASRRGLNYNTEQWSINADSGRDAGNVTGSLPAATATHTITTTNAPSHLARSSTINHLTNFELSIDSAAGEMGFFDSNDPFLVDEQDFHRASDDSTPLLPPSPGGILSAALSTNMFPAGIMSLHSPESDATRGSSSLTGISALSALSGSDDYSVEIPATASSGSEPHLLAPNVSQLDGDPEEALTTLLSTSVNLEDVPRNQTRPLDPESMVVKYEERIPDFFIFSQPKEEATHSTLENLTPCVGHPILIVEVKPLGPEVSFEDASMVLTHSTTQMQTAVQACVCLEDYKVDVITVMTVAGLWVVFDEYCREDVAPFLGRPIPDKKARPWEYAQPSSTSDVLKLFNDNLSDYSSEVMWHWRKVLQLA